jgi:DNA-binding transcriptional regulator YhcF (GntR family)
VDIEFNNNTPIYIQIMDWIKQQIISNKLKSGEKLHSIRDLSKLIRVNPNTIQRVYKELETEKIIFAKRGMGMFVTENDDVIKDLKLKIATGAIKEFVDKMDSMGYRSKEMIEALSEYLYKMNLGEK